VVTNRAGDGWYLFVSAEHKNLKFPLDQEGRGLPTANQRMDFIIICYKKKNLASQGLAASSPESKQQHQQWFPRHTTACDGMRRLEKSNNNARLKQNKNAIQKDFPVFAMNGAQDEIMLKNTMVEKYVGRGSQDKTNISAQRFEFFWD
jgi:hypothetical protein